MKQRGAIGKRLREIRGKATQIKLGARVGISPKYIGHVEKSRQKPSFNFLWAYSSYLGVSLDYMVLGIGDIYINKKS